MLRREVKQRTKRGSESCTALQTHISSGVRWDNRPRVLWATTKSEVSRVVRRASGRGPRSGDASERAGDKPPSFPQTETSSASIKEVARRDVVCPSYFSICSQESLRHNKWWRVSNNSDQLHVEALACAVGWGCWCVAITEKVVLHLRQRVSDVWL